MCNIHLSVLQEWVHEYAFFSSYTKFSEDVNVEIERMASSGSMRKIDEFSEVFPRFKERLSSRVEVHTAFVSSKVLETIGKLGKLLIATQNIFLCPIFSRI